MHLGDPRMVLTLPADECLVLRERAQATISVCADLPLSGSGRFWTV